MLKFLKKKRPKLLVIGLDGLEPDLVLSKWRSQLPNFDRLLRESAYGRLQSSTPCVPIPAWNVMMSGKDAGTLGIYSAEERLGRSYDGVRPLLGSAAKEPPVWEILGAAGKRVITVGVPGTYPPRHVNGAQISCSLTPGTVYVGADGRRMATDFTYPPALAEQVNHWAEGEYPVDVPLTAQHNPDMLIQQIYHMTDLHFKVAHKLLAQQMWDFFFSVEVGAARLQSHLWRYTDAHHPLYPGESPYQHVIRDYYIHLDRQIGDLLTAVDGSDTAVMIVSDRGAQSAAGGICVNDWLAAEEWLTYKGTAPNQPQPFQSAEIDWSKTLAWGEGGDFTRFFLNVEGREEAGVIPWSRYLHMRDELIARIREVRGPNGERLNTQIYKPEETYRHLHGCVPDLIVYWDNLRWRSISSIGHPSIWVQPEEGDTAPTPHGLYIFWHPKQKLANREVAGWEIMDVAPTILDYFQLPMPIEMQGRKIPLTDCSEADLMPPPAMQPVAAAQPKPRVPARKTVQRRPKRSGLQMQNTLRS